MSVTNATSTIDLSWQEVDVVSFTAGTMSTITDLQNEVEVKLQRGTLSTSTTPSTTQVQTWIIRAKEELMEMGGFSFARRYVYATATAGSYRFALPPDFGGGACKLRDITNNRTIRYTDRNVFDGAYPDPSEYGQGAIQNYTIRDREIWTYPAADGATLELEYTRTGDDNTATDISYLPERVRFKLVDMALVEGFECLQEFDKATYYERKGLGRIRMAKKGDNQKRWSSKRRAISWLEG